MHLDSIQVTNLSKRYGRHRALASVALDMRGGRLCALLGANGAGKSTLLKILSTLVRPTGGQVVYRAGANELPVGDELRGQIGVLSHEGMIYDSLTPRENLKFFASLYGVEEGAARIEALLDQVGLAEEHRDRAAGEFSRGMVQRLALARALLANPSVLLLDEPFTGLDRHGVSQLRDTMAQAKQDGRLQVVVTHDLEAIGGLAEQIVVLAGGRVVFDETQSAAGGVYSHEELKDVYHRYAS